MTMVNSGLKGLNSQVGAKIHSLLVKYLPVFGRQLKLYITDGDLLLWSDARAHIVMLAQH